MMGREWEERAEEHLEGYLRDLRLRITLGSRGWNGAMPWERGGSSSSSGGSDWAWWNGA